MKFLFKKLTVPFNNSTKEVETIQMWRVTWYSRYGEFSHLTRKQVEIFTNKEDAENFKESLVNAFKLIRHTCGNSLSLKKNE